MLKKKIKDVLMREQTRQKDHAQLKYQKIISFTRLQDIFNDLGSY